MNPACPACASETSLVGWEDVFGFECQECRAHLIRSNSIVSFLTKHQEALPYLEHLERVREAPASRRTLHCPDCQAGAYRKLKTDNVEVDACNGCGGLFLDEGEATRFLEDLRNTPPPLRLPRTFEAKRRRQEEIIAMMFNHFF
jgi:Zn-finger nucleic acid-binding protein